MPGFGCGNSLEHREVHLAIGERPPGAGRFVTLAARSDPLVPVAAGSGEGPRSFTRQTLLLRDPGSGTRSTAGGCSESWASADRAGDEPPATTSLFVDHLTGTRAHGFEGIDIEEGRDI